MYSRTTKRKNKDGSIVEYYQLAHNERHPDIGESMYPRTPPTRTILSSELMLTWKMGAGIFYDIQNVDMYDMWHPNETGYAKLANVWFSG